MLKQGECVALLHGLARTRRSMRPMAKFLSESGYEVRNLSYPSRKYAIEQLAEGLRPRIDELAEQFGTLHFVTHSMGGIVLRQMHAARRIGNIGRCVMLCPPNRGSQVVDRIGSWGLFHWVNGPAGRQLGTGEGSVPLKLGPADFELGVLAGDRSVDPFLSPLFDEPNDGKVAVSRAGLEGQSAFKTIPAGHTFFMRRRLVKANTLAFLRSGAFLAD